MSETIQSGGSFGSQLGNLGKKVPKHFAVPLATNNFPGLVSTLFSNAIINSKEKQVEKDLSEQEKDLLYLFQICKVLNLY